MQLIITLIRLGLSGLFGIAGIAKLVDRRGTLEAVQNFGVPARYAALVQTLLPLMEVAVAIGLLFGNVAKWSALVGLLLLGVFVVAISFNLYRGNNPECHCFGQIYSRPLGWGTLLRNGAFAVCAGLVVWRGDTGPDMWAFLTEFIASHPGLFAFLILLGVPVTVYLVTVYSKTREEKIKQASLASASNALPIDSAAPGFELSAYEGGMTSLRELLDRARPLVLIFTNPVCGPCVALFHEIGKWQRASDELTIAVISQGTVKDNFVNVARNDLRNILLQQEREVAELYGAKVTPSALIIRPDGAVGSRLAAGADEIRNLVQAITAENHRSLMDAETVGTD